MKSKTPKTQAKAQKPAPHLAEEPDRPSSSKWGVVKDSSLARGGLNLSSLSPGKSGGANLA